MVLMLPSQWEDEALDVGATSGNTEGSTCSWDPECASTGTVQVQQPAGHQMAFILKPWLPCYHVDWQIVKNQCESSHYSCSCLVARPETEKRSWAL